MVKLEILLECRRCGDKLRCEVDGVLRDDNKWDVSSGTLNNNYVLRWARSHFQPDVQLVAVNP